MSIYVNLVRKSEWSKILHLAVCINLKNKMLLQEWLLFSIINRRAYFVFVVYLYGLNYFICAFTY